MLRNLNQISNQLYRLKNEIKKIKSRSVYISDLCHELSFIAERVSEIEGAIKSADRGLSNYEKYRTTANYFRDKPENIKEIWRILDKFKRKLKSEVFQLKTDNQ